MVSGHHSRVHYFKAVRSEIVMFFQFVCHIATLIRLSILHISPNAALSHHLVFNGRQHLQNGG